MLSKVITVVAAVAMVTILILGSVIAALYIESAPENYAAAVNNQALIGDRKDQAQVYTRYPHLWLSEVIGFYQTPEPELARQAATYPEGYYLEGMTHKKQIALTFDDGPSVYSQEIVEVLERNDVPGTFFWMGSSVNKNPGIAKEISDKGYLIGNHTFSHRRNSGRNPQEFWRNSLEPTNEAIERATGKTPTLFRPSFGEISDEQINYINQQGMTVVNWSIDTRDWNELFVDANDIAKRVIDHQHPEAIVLMHDDGGDRSATVESLQAIIDHYKASGYEFVMVDQLLDDDSHSINAGVNAAIVQR